MISEARNCREEIPANIRNKPVLRAGLSLFLTAFYALDTERSMADLQPIPWSGIKAYSIDAGCTERECEEMEYFVRYIDNIYLRSTAARRKQA